MQILGSVSSVIRQNLAGSETGDDREFHGIGVLSARGLSGIGGGPEEFLAREYGRKKIKVNFYDGENFVCTINFKVGGWESHDDD